MNSEDLELLIVRLKDSDPEIQKCALDSLHSEVKSSVGTVQARIQTLQDLKKEFVGCISSMDEVNQRHLNDLLSVISTIDNDDEVLKFKLQGNVESIAEWGHQYVKKLVFSIVSIIKGEAEVYDYTRLVAPIVDFLFAHNSEVEAIDFVIEISGIPTRHVFNPSHSFFDSEIVKINTQSDNAKQGDADEASTSENQRVAPKHAANADEVLQLIIKYTDEDNRERILAYLEDMERFYDLENIILQIKSFDKSSHLVALLKYGRTQDAIEYVKNTEDKSYKRQLLYILAKNSIYYQGTEEEERILSHSFLPETYLGVAASLEIMAPKKLDYLFKGLNQDRIDVASIANALVHFGFQRDPVFYPQKGDYRIKEEYSEQLKINKSISTIASIGVINAFEPARVYEDFGKFILESPEIGSVLALALASYKHDSSASILSLLSIFMTSDDQTEVICALAGISILFAGSHNKEVYDVVFPLLSNGDENIMHFALYVLGVVFPGDVELFDLCVEVYQEMNKETPLANFSLLGISYFFYTSGTAVNEESRASPEFISQQMSKLDRHSKILAYGFANIGTGDQTVIDKIMSQCFFGEIDALMETLGLVACALVGIGDSVSSQLIERITTSSLLLDSPHLRNIAPLCIALLYASNPRQEVLDFLERNINGGEALVSSLVALGIVGAGTCSSKILKILDNNFGQVYKDPKSSAAFLYTQGLVNLGKGMCTLSPLAYNKNIILQRSVLGLVSTIFLFMESSIFADCSFLLYFIINSVNPRYVAGLEASVKVGIPINVVGLAGKPNKLSATVVHEMPVLLGENERAEINTGVCTRYIEDIVVSKE
ncbi:26S proteasome regulatory subunit N1 [Enteropsectra breve]|nr:26S proteasome regulatory subunit N1 [Enteropsectra breve]